MTGMSLVDVNTSAGQFFGAFNILGMGLVLIWIVGSIFLARALSEKKDEWIMTTIILLMFGGVIFLANDPGKYVILIVLVIIVIFGMYKLLWKRKEERD